MGIEEALAVGVAAMLAGPSRPHFIVTSAGLILHREMFESMAGRLPGHWALLDPRPFGEPPRRGGLARCRTFACVLAAALVAS